MILRESVSLGLGGGHDEDGKVIPPRQAAYLAEVSALSAEESSARGREPSSVAYRVTLPRLRSGDVLTAASSITWRGIVFGVVGPPMVHTVASRVHHIEVVMASSTG